MIREAVKEREDLHKTLWNVATLLRGNVDGWDFKQYVLGTLFYRYISETLSDFINQNERATNPDFDYALLTDDVAEAARSYVVDAYGFFLLPSQLFCNVVKNAATDENLNITLYHIFSSIDASAKGDPEREQAVVGLFEDFDVNSKKLGATVVKRNEKLRALLETISHLDLGDCQDHRNDVFGDAYEYLMAMYASNAGKSGGEYFTPAEVSRLLALLAVSGRKHVSKVYDPACGSGSLLLQMQKILHDQPIEYYGQEINITTQNLCRFNMHLHGVNYKAFHIACEDTLKDPQWEEDGPFDTIVSNPPYSIHWEGDSNPVLVNDRRFSPAGVLAPKNKADMAFLMHIQSYLSNDGAAAVVCFPGVMYRSGSEKKIRKFLVDNNLVDAIIQLPSNLFFGTQIATCIMVMRKNKRDTGILFMDASKECVKVTNNNRLSDENISRILKLYCDRQDIAHLVRVASYEDVVDADYNLSVSTYVEPEDTREKVDIVKLNAEIEEIVTREQILRDEIDKIIAEIEGDMEA